MSGVTPTGYVLKTPQEILSGLETKMEAVFGEGVIMTAQSPLGQLLGLMTDFAAEMEERNQGIYQSYDPTQAEGVNLNRIGNIRGLSRGALNDARFSRVITNENNRAINMADRIQKVMEVDGVSWVAVRENSAQFSDSSGIPPHTIAFAVIGGNDADVARAIYNNTISGIGLYGMTTVPVTIGGYCRQINFIRPHDIPVYADLTIRLVQDVCSCGLTSPQEVVDYLDAAANGGCGLINGDLIDQARIEALLGPIGGLSVTSALVGIDPNDLTADGLQFDVLSRPVLVAKNISVRFS
ncbi:MULTISPECIES: hypothetical protein [unclassified Shinella]|uniref:hypothetical protein n=1 Tax=unclassified Shinella TaxID=2643062 RepID=UPI00234E7C3F|nr:MULTISPECIES: hypothetical protein [unclassified Shinella]MCO5152596.1 hypothetical protein [Shinella sp.]MDC7261891.1 hypothetical protein [Shinella sp. HY16]MDC7268786.1 hypothetical protein [Shinella sp. YZ44]